MEPNLLGTNAPIDHWRTNATGIKAPNPCLETMRYGRLAKVVYTGWMVVAAPTGYQVTLPLRDTLISLLQKEVPGTNAIQPGIDFVMTVCEWHLAWIPASIQTLGAPGPALAIWITLISRPSWDLPIDTVFTKSNCVARSSM